MTNATGPGAGATSPVIIGGLLAELTTLLLAAPVSGPVVRPYEYGHDPFARGQHRGVDLAAPAGADVRAPCSGRVVAARVVAGVPVVSLSCSGHRVSLMPVRASGLRVGATARRRRALGRVAPGRGPAMHRGALHVGVRREGRHWEYLEPVFDSVGKAPPPVPVLRRPWEPRRPGRPRPLHPARRPPLSLASAPAPAAAPVPAAAPASAPAPVPASAPASAAAPVPAAAQAPATALPLAPPLAWAGASLVLAAVLGGWALHATRRRRARRVFAPALDRAPPCA